MTKKLTQEEYINRAATIHNNFYSYDKAVYKRMHDLLLVTCPIHGDFEVSASNHTKILKNKPHLAPCGCPKCGTNKVINRNIRGRMEWNVFVDRASMRHMNKYSYIHTHDYAGVDNKVHILCPDHGEFVQTGTNHLRGTGCPRCKNSGGETMVAKTLSRLQITYIREHTFGDCKGDNRLLKFDFWLPTHNTLIEYDGEQHFKPVRFHQAMSNETAQKMFLQTARYDQIKNQYAESNGIRLIRIPYKDRPNIANIITSSLF